ncbi:galactokinase [Radiobacillus deserti]|uniref:Galactokinase n=1 Tax=Radiobacillus deserti TaxID=2594883 RepID=A0A516KK86_9BACI|nr:galactokinase [Radiobacillus deserti]QDP41792.1 galactokinase [Radiobacillus deserti]
MNVAELTKSFEQIFQRKEQPRVFFAPGRINLIGEHTDYNGGHVFPAAISFGTYALVLPRDDQMFRFYSMNFMETGILSVPLDNLSYKDTDKWMNYPKGVLKLWQEKGLSTPYGADILYYGNIPNGAGLSSSASIELATAVLLEGLYGVTLDRLDMIKLGQRVENEYIGVNSGIMDQFAIGMGKKDHAILLDCQSLSYQYAPIELDDHTIVIMNTNKRRELAGSKYNERRAECERALADLQNELSITSLGDLTESQFETHKYLIKQDSDRKRAKHAVYENQRTIRALAKLKAGKLGEFGTLMNDSHVSLQKDYEVTGLELDTIVQAAWQQEGVLGARMTGAGFGGCAIAIVEKQLVSKFQKNVTEIYRTNIGYEPTFYQAAISDGAKELKIERSF